MGGIFCPARQEGEWRDSVARNGPARSAILCQLTHRAGVEFSDEHGGGLGVHRRKGDLKCEAPATVPLTHYALSVISGNQASCNSFATVVLCATASTSRDCYFVKNADKLRLAVGASFFQNMREM